MDYIYNQDNNSIKNREEETMDQNLHIDVKNILVLGAGQLGLAVLNSLQPKVAQLGGDITALISPSSLDENNMPTARPLKFLADQGVKFEAIDLANISNEALVTYFSKFQTIISCTGFVAGSGTQLKITQAVIEAKVKRYFPWQFGVDYDIVGKGSSQPVFDEQYEVRTLLRQQQGTEWIIVSTGMFTSFLFEPAFDVVNLKEGYINALGSWENKVTVTSPDDIGMLTTMILLESPRITNEVIFIAGDTISYGELADIVDSVTNKIFKRNIFSLKGLQNELAQNPDNQMQRYQAAFAQGDGMWWSMENTYNYIKGISTQNVEQWLIKHLK